MNCFEDAVQKLTGFECPPLGDDDVWTQRLQAWLAARGFRAQFEVLDKGPVIVSRRLPNGKVHAEVMHPTLLTTINPT